MAAGWFYSPEQIKRYILTRSTSLKPPRTKIRNPIAILRELDRHQWLMFTAGFLGWTWDAFDFFTVSLCVTEIAEEFGVSNADVSWGITVTLMLRSVGALIFGTLSDRWGRKWTFIGALVLFIILELASGFAMNLQQFLAVRSLYGIAMGGMYGPAAATALEDIPYDARGLLSGIYQQGYACGYMLAALFYRAVSQNFILLPSFVVLWEIIDKSPSLCPRRLAVGDRYSGSVPVLLSSSSSTDYAFRRPMLS